MTNEIIDAAILTDKQIKEAFSEHCRMMGSAPYYYADELERWRTDPACVVVFRDHTTLKLRAYTRTRRPEEG